MYDIEKELEELCEQVDKSLMRANEELRSNGRGGLLNGEDAHYIKSLAGARYYLKAGKAMDEAEYSEHGGHYGAFADGSNRSERSMARGRRNARRDSMGRFSREGGNSMGGYSRADEREDMISELEELSERYNDRKYKTKIQELIEQIENS